MDDKIKLNSFTLFTIHLVMSHNMIFICFTRPNQVQKSIIHESLDQINIKNISATCAGTFEAVVGKHSSINANIL